MNCGFHPGNPGLARFNEKREFPSEGGRTNRGNNKPVSQLLAALDNAGFASLSKEDRIKQIDGMQESLVQSLDAYYKLERIRITYDAGSPARTVVGHILEKAGERDQAGPVAQHLVGAKLAIRFPHLEVGNFPYSAADDQAGRTGDFHVGETAFHVTAAPSDKTVERCARNLRGGIAAFLLVPDSKVERARILLDLKGLGDRAPVESIESFVGQNLSELGGFARPGLRETIGELLVEYNRRVNEVETDGALQIEIPTALGDGKE